MRTTDVLATKACAVSAEDSHVVGPSLVREYFSQAYHRRLTVVRCLLKSPSPRYYDLFSRDLGCFHLTEDKTSLTLHG